MKNFSAQVPANHRRLPGEKICPANEVTVMNVDNARKFAFDWHGRGYEKGETQKFWLALLRDVCGAERPDKIIDFEKRIKIDEQTKFADGYIARTKVLIEQKSLGVDLSEDVFEQAKLYADNMIYSERPRWIVTCNFAEFRIYDLLEMDSLEYRLGAKTYEPFAFKLSEINYMCRRLRFLVDPNVTDIKPEIQISLAAAKIVDVIYNAFRKSYENAHVKGYKTFLDKLCTRLVFCFYASHAQILDDKFFGYLSKFDDKQRLDALQRIFDVLSTPENERPESLDDDLKKFPHINGGLFNEKIVLPKFSASEGDPTSSIAAADNKDRFNWRKIDLPIFGAMFESILDDEQRREGGMHYTARENIHKVIDPLFLDDLHKDFDTAVKKRKNRAQALLDLQNKIAKLTFLDPACGSGNFLTETYLSLRALENKILEELQSLHVELPENPVKVSIEQFYGIEINDFAVAVAQVAMWIAENQKLQETEGELGKDLNAFPLKHYPKIVCANALRVDWQKVFGSDAPETFNYIIGNPPYRGARNKSDEQSADIRKVFAGWKKLGNLDYVTCWYKKAADFIRNTETRCAFISTNSVCQGDSVGALWKKLFADGVHIDFARRTFKWLSDSDNPAQVYCVIVGFSKAPNDKDKVIFDGDKDTKATNINAYLVDGENIFVESRNEPLCDVPKIGIGNKPIDDGNYLFTPDEMERFFRAEPAAAKFFRPWYGADEFIKGKRRYCLWLGDTPLDEIKKLPHCWERVENVRRSRLSSKSPGTRKIADKPTRFHVENFPHGKFLVMAKTSSGERQYIPMGFMDDSVLCSDKVFVLPDATPYRFGVLTSSIHMAWTRATNCTLGTGYSYSIGIVYNNFPWPTPTSSQRRLIEQSAQAILDARAKFPDWTFAKLYDENTMPDELRSAHHTNDYNVALAYGFEKFLTDEAKVVAELMKLYAALA